MKTCCIHQSHHSKNRSPFAAAWAVRHPLAQAALLFEETGLVRDISATSPLRLHSWAVYQALLSRLLPDRCVVRTRDSRGLHTTTHGLNLAQLISSPNTPQAPVDASVHLLGQALIRAHSMSLCASICSPLAPPLCFLLRRRLYCRVPLCTGREMVQQLGCSPPLRVLRHSQALP